MKYEDVSILEINICFLIVSVSFNNQICKLLSTGLQKYKFFMVLKMIEKVILFF